LPPEDWVSANQDIVVPLSSRHGSHGKQMYLKDENKGNIYFNISKHIFKSL